MSSTFGPSRRAVLGGAVAAAAWASLPAWAQAKPTFRLNTVYNDRDLRAEVFRNFAKDVAGDVTIEPHYGATLFKQGTEMVALQRGNLEMAHISPSDITKQIPAWGVLSAAYLFRDPGHVLRFFQSEAGKEYVRMAETQAGIKVLGPVYYGTRQVGLRGKKKIATPSDLAGVKLRMPPGDAWQLMGRALGANPTPMAFAEVYTGLQTGAIDGQDNPLPGVNAAKFHEVMGQIVLTSHWVAFDIMAMNLKAWNDLGAERQGRLQAAVDRALNNCVQEYLTQENGFADTFRKAGLDVYAPNQDAFRAHAQKVYLESPDAKAWLPGAMDKVAAVK